MSGLIYIGGFSGGIDSQAAVRFMLNRYDAACVVLVNADAGGNEHPLTIEHIDWYSGHVHPVARITAKVGDFRTDGWCAQKGVDPDADLTFPELARIKGRFPSRRAQFCTEALKLAPIRRWIDEHYPDGNYARFTGVRRDESLARSDRQWQEWDDYYDCELLNPVYDWSKQMCFDYVRAHGERVNPLYSLGFTRVGCAPCINSGKDDILNWSTGFPAMIDKVRAWEQHVGRTFFAPCVRHGHQLDRQRCRLGEDRPWRQTEQSLPHTPAASLRIKVRPMRIDVHASSPVYRLLQGDVLVRLRELPDESVQCVVTSPPYWGLRDYGVAAQIGQEPTPDEYVLKLVAVFREVRRVLRCDGNLWLNVGDTYFGSWGNYGGQNRGHGTQRDIIRGSAVPNPAYDGLERYRPPSAQSHPVLKPKDLAGIPWMLASALRADGWWLRSDIIWHKPNTLPESVTDRPTKSHEYLFLLTRNSAYYYDAEAISEIAVGDTPGNLTHKDQIAYENGDVHIRTKAGLAEVTAVSRRNKRSVWTIAVEAFSEAHFATFPTKLVDPCILAGTSEHGCCASCGAPWKRITERTYNFQSGSGKSGHAPSGKFASSAQAESGDYDIRLGPVVTTVTTGWQPTCACDATITPCTVLDPFSGAGTTGLVALRLGRNYIGIELNPEYVAMSERRIREDAPLFRQGDQA